MKILHTADLHLRESEGPRWKALEALVKLAKDKKVDVLTISGDLFDQNFNANQARSQIRSVFNDSDVTTIIIPGNHDDQAYQQGLDFGQNTQVITDLKNPIQIKDTVIYGLPFTTLTQEQLLGQLQGLKNKLDPDQTNILLFHGELLDQFFSSQDFGQEGEQRYLPVKLDYFANLDLDYVLAGHFHTSFASHRLPNQRLDQGGYFIYPGSPISITRRETGKRHAALITTGGNPDPIELNTPYFHLLELEIEPNQTTDPVKQLGSELKKLASNAQPIVKLSGYFDSQKINQTEKQLKTKLEKIKTDHPDLVLQNHVSDISHVLDSGLYQAFISKMNLHQDKYQQPEKLKQTLIQAMIKVNN